MPKVQDKYLRPYIFHGLQLSKEGKEAIGDCPFCGRQGKFSVNVETGLWRCFLCAEGTNKGGGNIYTFIELLWKYSDKESNGHINAFAKKRKLLYPETLLHWGVCRSIISGEWLVPGFNVKGELRQLYQYLRLKDRKVLMPTPEISHQLHGVPQWKDDGLVYICEGPWDAMALWEVLQGVKAKGSVVAVPNCGAVGTPFQTWLPLFADSDVVLLFDNDYPANQGKADPSGWAAMKRAAGLLGASEFKPRSVHYVRWGKGTYNPELPEGYDVRDHLAQRETLVERAKQAESLFAKTEPVPAEWLSIKGEVVALDGIGCLPCFSWAVLEQSWRKTMRWTPGLRKGLACVMACITSTKALGPDQLWIKLISPPATGKSTLCEAAAVARKYIVPKDTVTGLLSGYQTKDGENLSLVELLRDKTLIIKDADTILSAKNLDQILSQFRALYDRAIRSQYGNQMSTDHESVNSTVIFSGTNNLKRLDASELGERFLDVIIMEAIDPTIEDEILWKVANQSEGLMSHESDGKAETFYSPDRLEAYRLTGGYIDYLRQNAKKLLGGVIMPEPALGDCVRYGKLVAYMRARPSKTQDEWAERELATRLVSQIVRLAKCLAVVLNKTSVDDEILQMVKQVALDTAKGRVLSIVAFLHPLKEGVSSGALAIWTGEGEEKEKTLLKFLRKIGVVESYQKKMGATVTHTKWRLTRTIHDLYSEVMGKEQESASTDQ